MEGGNDKNGIQLVSYGSVDLEKGKGVDNPSLDPQGDLQDLQEPVVSYSAVDEKLTSEKPGLGAGDGGSSVSVKVEGDGEVRDKPYAGMGKEDLLRFSDTPFWNRFRLISILIFWGAWLALLGAVIGLTIVAPRCGDRPTPSWWQKSTIYQIYVRSFYDSNGDGVGDIRGVIEKLDYIEQLNVSAILLSSVYESSNVGTPDYGYEITNHMSLAPEYGNLADLDELLEAAHNKSISVIMDFIPNHTGLGHQWFQLQNDPAITNRYWNFYIWAPCTYNDPDVVIDNNWRSVYGEGAWTWYAPRSQCYLHQFLTTQPELNLRSSAVLEELEGILRFWLDRGVDGFRVINSDHLVESVDLQNETPITPCTDPNTYNCLNHIYTRSQQENYDLISRWRDIVKEYSPNDLMRERILITDADVSMGEGLKYYGRRGDGANLPINYQLANIPANCAGRCISDMLQNFTESLPENATATWLISNQDTSRQPTRFSPDLLYASQLLQLTLPGSALVYYGDELGMVNYNNPIQRDPAGDINPIFSRDRYRSPMQWSNESRAGFTTGTSPWLEVNPDYLDTNAGELEAIENSTLKFFKMAADLKKNQESFQYGQTHYLTSGVDENLIAYVREHEGFNRYLVVINFGSSTVTDADVTRDKSSIGVPGKAVVVLNTHSDMLRKVDQEIDLRKVTLEKGQGFIAKWEYTRPN